MKTKLFASILFLVFSNCKKENTILGNWQTVNEPIITDYKITVDSFCAAVNLDNGKKIEFCRVYVSCDDVISVFDVDKIIKVKYEFDNENLILSNNEQVITLQRK